MHKVKSAKVVIGAAFGDCGKGLLVDKYAADAKTDTVVCRFSGGANAGHTVVTPDGTRHVFSHFGAGTLAGASTHLSKFFIVNPFLWRKEAHTLRDLGHWSRTTIDGTAMMSTPYDMLINQFSENARGGKRHGSVGVGINETVHRCSIPIWHTPAAYAGKHFLKKTLIDIREGYVFPRLDDLGVALEQSQIDLLRSEAMIDDFVAASREMASFTILADSEIMLRHKTIIFEGSQGLLLDERHTYFPHVTRARTGLTNVSSIARDLDLKHLDVTYVSRAYTTRHGRGPLPHEDGKLRYHDDTNQPNEWQEALRFAPLDVVLLGQTIMNDLHSSTFPGIEPTIAITHMDQIDQRHANFHTAGFRHQGSWRQLVDACIYAAHIDRALVSFGPTRNDISEFASAKRIFA